MFVRHTRLAAAVLGVSVTAFAFAQSAQQGGQSGAQSGPQSGSQSGAQSGSPSGGQSGARPGQAGQGTDTPTPAPGRSDTDGMGNTANTQNRDMQRGQMGGADADRAMMAQLDKIASMPDKAPDALFALGAAAGNLWEVEFSRLAQSKAQDQKVKDLARKIEQDHGQANQRLQPIAQKMGLELPRSLPTDKQKKLSIYQAMSPQDFETCYLLENKAGHAKSITSYTDHQKSVKDEELRRYVTESLPKLQQHGMHIQEVAAAKGFGSPILGGNMGGASGTHGHGSDVPGVTNQSPDPRNPVNQQNPSDR
jgi:putative membrane protein